MKLYAPKYYKNFKCIADKCEHSCCIGWEIDIDDDTLLKYNSLSCSYSENIQNSIDYCTIPHFRFSNNHKCPHLDEKGLCKIIKNVGEDFLCDICREHPRFYNFTNAGKEVGIGMSCESACSLILSSDNFDEIILIDEIDGKTSLCQYDALNDRSTVFKILKIKELNIHAKIEMIFDYFDICLHEYNYSDITSELEYLDEEDKVLFQKATEIKWNNSINNELSRILAYFVYRHCSEATDFEEFSVSLSFAIFCTGLISTLSNTNNIFEIARIVSEEIEYCEENIERIKYLFYLE